MYSNETTTTQAIVQSGQYALIAAEPIDALDRALTNLGYVHYHAVGSWKGEKEASILVVGISEDAAVGCGIAFRQDAVIVNGKLIDCKPPHRVTAFDNALTIYGDEALACDGHTVCNGVVWALVPRANAIPDAWPIVMSCGLGTIYALPDGDYAVGIEADDTVTMGVTYDQALARLGLTQ